MQATETYNQKEQRNTKRSALWTGLWLVSTALLAFGPKLIWD